MKNNQEQRKLMRFAFSGLFLLPLMAASIVFGACSGDAESEAIPSGEADVAVRIETAGWEATRAAGEMLRPVTLLVVPDGSDEIEKRITVTDGAAFNVTLTNGTYDLVAVCGLDASLIQPLYSDAIDVPAAKDFAVGVTQVTVEKGVCTPSVVSINAHRQMSWLDLTLTGVPENIATLNLYVKGLYETYSLDSGWKISSGGVNRFTQIPLTKNGNQYEAEQIMFPCSNAMGVTFVAEATTTGGTTTLLTYTSAAPLKAGVHLVQTLDYGDMMVVEGGINLGDWTEREDDGTLTGGFDFAVGQQYFSQAATVVYKGTTQMLLWPHRPMVVTLDEVRAWDKKHVPYTLLPDVKVLRWAFPTSATTPSNIFVNLQSMGWSQFDATFAASGNTPIDRTKTNVVAYYDSAADKFYVYDFANGQFQDVADETGEFLVYPLGLIQMTE